MSGGTIRLDGPINVPKMDAYKISTGEKLGDEPDSLITGSRAWLESFSSENYSKTVRYFDPNQSIADLSVYDMGGKMDSFKLYDQRPDWWPGSSVNGLIEIDGGPVSSATVNNVCRDILGTALSQIPYAGPFMETILNGLWPDRNNLNQVWACFQNYINQVVGGIYQQIIVTGLTIKLQGLYSLTRAYIDAPAEKRAGSFTSLKADLLVQEPFFLSLEKPQDSLSFFIPFGSLMLATLAEEIASYERIYGVPASGDERSKLIGELQARIDLYQRAVAKARESILAQRASMVVVRDETPFNLTGTKSLLAVDLYDGWRDKTVDSLSKANFRAGMRAESVVNVLAYELDQNLSLTQLWSWFNPDKSEPLQSPSIIVRDGPYGDYQCEPFSCEAGLGRISKVAIWTGDLVDCLEVFIDGASTGKKGRSNVGDDGLHFLELAADEVIIEVNGVATGLINQIGFTTNKGRNISGGKGSPNDRYYFTSRAPSGTADGCLVGISGYSENSASSRANLKVVTLHWECLLPLPEIEAVEQSRAKIA